VALVAESFPRVAVLGTGLMGGSLALALKAVPGVEEVVGHDISPETREIAERIGVCDIVAESPAEAVEGSSLVFLATPVGAMPSVLTGVRDSFGEGTVVTDLGSTKLRLTEALEALTPEGVHYIGGHPMTGSEQSGILSAREDLYRDCYYVLTPTKRTDAEAFRLLHCLITSLGSRVISMEPETHDLAMATVSHVPHLLSQLLMELAGREREKVKNLFTLAAGGFRDMTRIAASSPSLWADICIENRDFIVGRLIDYGVALTELADAIDRGDRSALIERFEEARRQRIELSSKAGLEIADLFEVSIPVPDEPGVISDVSTAVGEAGVNIEDIEIAHPLEGETGILSLKILGEEPSRLAAEQLESRGYRATTRKV